MTDTNGKQNPEIKQNQKKLRILSISEFSLDYRDPFTLFLLFCSIHTIMAQDNEIDTRYIILI